MRYQAPASTYTSAKTNTLKTNDSDPRTIPRELRTDGGNLSDLVLLEV